MNRIDYFATTARGLEEILAGELQALGVVEVRPVPGGVHFRGDRTDGYRACLWLRTANRVLQPVATFACASADQLYEGVRNCPWEGFLTPGMTLALDASVRDSALTHSRFAALKGKDAIVDRLRDLRGWRPDIDPAAPDLPVNLHIHKNRCTVSLDLAGDGLHRRGYRLERTVAPLRETLAAGLLLLSGWDGTTPFVDPMCGSGTLPIEAALIATRTAPGLGRGFAFQKWPGFDAGGWQALRDEAHRLRRPAAAPIIGADRDPRALAAARDNAARQPAAGGIRWERSDFARFEPPAGPGTLLCNPPYGERLKDDGALELLYRSIGDTLKQRWTGWTAWLLTGNLEAAKRIGLKATRRVPLWNGPLECRLLKYELY
ncbi:MAG: RNA methyltransferase [Deltaproteobacteria bacterium]|nr:MAG: RNA methyltransferase [Deltaproteobacteria bacterium]